MGVLVTKKDVDFEFINVFHTVGELFFQVTGWKQAQRQKRLVIVDTLITSHVRMFNYVLITRTFSG